MSNPTLPDQHAAEPAADALRILPRARGARIAVWVVTAILGVLTFSAWLQPNMVFDLANMVFCF